LLKKFTIFHDAGEENFTRKKLDKALESFTAAQEVGLELYHLGVVTRMKETRELQEHIAEIGRILEEEKHREEAEAERKRQLEIERSRLISILQAELTSGQQLVVKNLVHKFGMDIDSARAYLVNLEREGEYDADDVPSLKGRANDVLKALPEPTLLGVLELPWCTSVAMAKAVGKYLMDEKIITAFPHHPRRLALSPTARPDQAIPIPFPAFQRSTPFVFASYAHADKDRVYPILLRLHQAGVRVWYDEGIPATEIWQKAIAKNLAACTAFVAFLSPIAVTRVDVLDEIAFAKERYKQGNLVFLPVFLEKFTLPQELVLSIGRIQGLVMNDLPLTSFHEKLLAALPETVK
jgi:hypothetical protein